MRNTPALIRALLNQAADEIEETGNVYVDTQAHLDRAGYCLCNLDVDVAYILSHR